MPRSHENYGQSRQLRARTTWKPIRACDPWDARTKFNLLRCSGHMQTGDVRVFYGVSTVSRRCFAQKPVRLPYGYRTVHVRVRTVHVRAPYRPVRA